MYFLFFLLYFHSFLFLSFSFSFPLFYNSYVEGLGLIQADEAIGSSMSINPSPALLTHIFALTQFLTT